MLAQVLTATFSLFSAELLGERVVVTPRIEELPEVVRAVRHDTPGVETCESRLFAWLDH